MATNKTQLKGVIMLLLTAFIWGSSFVAQSIGMEAIEAFTFNGIRTLMGAVVLLPVVFFRDKSKTEKMDEAARRQHKALNRKTLIYGSILGVFLCIASNFQQFAFNYSESGKIAFITSLYILIVPLLSLIFRKKVPVLTWICVAVGFVGLYFLCIDPNNIGAINFGDILTLICAFFFAVHILLVERFVTGLDGVKLSCIQFFVSGTISCILMFIFESPDIEAIGTAIVPLLYSGVMSCGLAYTFQIIGQKYTEATVASLLMCMESVFGVLCGALILHEALSPREIIGCVIMFAAILISQAADVIKRHNPHAKHP